MKTNMVVESSLCRSSRLPKAVERMARAEVFADDEFRAREEVWVLEEAAKWGIGRREALIVLQLHYDHIAMHSVRAERPAAVRKERRTQRIKELIRRFLGHAS